MQITLHTYRMPLLRSIVLVSAGVLFTACSFLLIFIMPGLWGSLTVSQPIGGQVLVVTTFLIIVFFSLFIGLVLILHPIYCRLILASDGLEYQTFAGSLKSAWADMYKLDVPAYTAQPRTIVLASRKPQVHLRGWTRLVPWNISRGFAQNGIPLQQFGKLSGSTLEADLINFAPGLTLALQSAPTQSLQGRVGTQTFSLKESLKILWFFAIALTFWLVWIGQSMKLTCDHDLASGQVNCINQKSWYSRVLLGTQEFRAVREARLTISRDFEGDVSYQLHLLSENGDDSLLYMPMPGYGKETVVKQFNEFLQNPSDAIYVLEQKPRWLNATIVLYLALGTTLSGIWLFWPQKKKLDANLV